MELLVAMAITTIIVTILVGITSVSIDAWQRSRSEVRASRQAKAMVDSMARDFEAMVSRRGNSFEWLVAQSSTVMPGPSGNKGIASTSAVDLVWFTAATDRYKGQINTSSDLGGDVSCVGYQLAYRDPITTATSSNDYQTFVLNRLLVDPNDTFTNLLGKTDLKSAFATYSTQIPNLENYVCENIFQFTVTFHVEVTRTVGTATTKTIIPVVIGTAGGSKTNSVRLAGTGLNVGTAVNGATLAELNAGRLVAAEISLTVVTDSALSQLRTRSFTSNATDANSKQKFLAKNSYQYSKRVEIPSP